MEEDKDFQGVICIHSLDSIHMFHVHSIWPVYSEVLLLWKAMSILRTYWGTSPQNKLLLEGKIFFMRKRQFGVTNISTRKWGDYRVCPEQEEITSEAGEIYDFSVGRQSSKPEGLVSHRKGLEMGRRVIYVQVAAVQSFPPPALILEHSHYFGTVKLSSSFSCICS